MTNNPILAAVADMATARDWPIAGVTVAAPLAIGAPTLTICWAQWGAESDHGIAPPDGVGVTVLSRVPDTITMLPPMIAAESMVIAAAWAHGAWDIHRVAIAAGYDGALPPGTPTAAWRAQGWVSWYWRPMMRGPEIRARQHRPDLTLDPWTLGRMGEPPEIRVPQITPGRTTVIKLGRAEPAPRRHRARPATARQRAYLAHLLAEVGEDTTISAGLDRAEASAWIDRLISRRGT